MWNTLCRATRYHLTLQRTTSNINWPFGVLRRGRRSSRFITWGNHSTYRHPYIRVLHGVSDSVARPCEAFWPQHGYTSVQAQSQHLGQALHQGEQIKKNPLLEREAALHAFQEATSLAASVGSGALVPRRSVGRQSTRSNTPAATLEELFSRNCFLPFLDHLVFHLDDRFLRDDNSVPETVILQELILYFTKEESVTKSATWSGASLGSRFELPNRCRSLTNSQLGRPRDPPTELLFIDVYWWSTYHHNVQSRTCIARMKKNKIFVFRGGFSCVKTFFFLSSLFSIAFTALFLCPMHIRWALLFSFEKTRDLFIGLIRSTMSQERLTGLALLSIHSDRHLSM